MGELVISGATGFVMAGTALRPLTAGRVPVASRASVRPMLVAFAAMGVIDLGQLVIVALLH